MILSTALAELSLEASALQWSQDIFAEKFYESYKLIRGGGRSVVGASEVCRSRYFGRRWLHWEAAGGVVCLREIWLDNDMVDNALFLKFGDIYLGAPLSVHFESLPPSGDGIDIRVCFVMCDGSLHHITLSSQREDRSVLADLVDYQGGGLLSTRTEKVAYNRCVGLVKSHQINDSVRDNQTICCASHLSHFGVIFGLSQGDIVYVRMSPDRLFVETVLRDEGALSALWSGIVGPAKRPAVLATSGSHLRDLSISVAVSADGVLRVWDCLSRSCLKQLPMLSLIQDDIGQQDAIMEGVCVDTNPQLSGGEGLIIAMGITARVGRTRTWTVVVMSWDAVAAAHVPVRAYLTPPGYDNCSLDSTDVSLEQITINPCCSHQSNALCVVSLWNVNGDIVPVQHVLAGLDWSPQAHKYTRGDNAPSFAPIIASFGPAETHHSLSIADGYLINRAERTAGWTPLGEKFDGTIEMRSRMMKMTFLQRLFYAGRFSSDIIVGMLSHDVPYELQESYTSLSDYVAENAYATADILMEKVIAICEVMEEALVQEMRISGSEDSIPTLRLRAQAEVSLRVLSMCEARKKNTRSSSGACSVLMRSRGQYEEATSTPAESTVPFEFVVVRPSGVGVAVWANCLGDSRVEEIPNYITTPNARLNFRAQINTDEIETHARVAAVQILSAVARAIDCAGLHDFDAAMHRFVGDVVSVDLKNAEWIGHTLKCLVLDMDIRAIEFVSAAWSTAVGAASESDALSVIEHMVNGIGGSVISLAIYTERPSDSEINDSARLSSPKPLCGTMGSKLLQECCTLALRDHYDYSKTVTCALLTLLSTDTISLSDSLQREISERYLPQVVCYMAHCSLVLWLHSIHVSNNRQLERTIDFEDVQYDSSLITSLQGVSVSPRTGTAALGGGRSDGSLWTLFWRRECSLMEYGINHDTDTIDWENITKQCIIAVRPSCQSDLLSFLYSRGQYACVARATAIGLCMESLPTVRPPLLQAPDLYSQNYAELSSYFTLCHNKSIHAISYLQSHLRDICNVSYDMSDDQSSCDDTLQQELRRCVEILISIPTPPRLQAEGGYPSIVVDITDIDDDRYISDDVTGRENIYRSIVDWVRNAMTVHTEHFDKEALLCFGESLIKLSHSGCFRSLYTRLQQVASATDQHPVDALVVSYPELLLQLHTVYHHNNTLRLMDRARAVLPSLCGDSLALRSCYCTIDSIQSAKNYLFAELGDWVLSPALVNELDIEWAAVWCSVFKFALHSTLLDEALSAVVELINLSRLVNTESYLLDRGTTGRFTSHRDSNDRWKSSLRALISRACATGHMGWLCSIPETIGGNEEGPLIDLTAEICSEMEFLAISSDLGDIGSLSTNSIISASTDTPGAVSMYEYLGTFLLSKSDFAACARVMYQYYGRLEVECPPTLGCLSIQARCLSTAISALLNVPESQQFIVYRTHHLKNTSDRNDRLLSPHGKRSLNGVREAQALAADSNGKLSYVTLAELEHASLQLECKATVAAHHNTDASDSTVMRTQDDMDIVRMLCAQDNFFDALNLARHNFPTQSSSGRNLVLEFVVDSLAAKCAIDKSSKESSVAYEQFVAVHGCTSLPMDHMCSNGLMGSPTLWEYLVKCMHIIDGPAQNWALHKIASQAALRVAPTESLPALLTSSHCGEDGFFQDRDKLLLSKRVLGASHVALPSKCTGNIPALIRTLVKEGALVEACDLASTALVKCDPVKKRLEIIPLDALDQLLHACADAIAIAHEDGLMPGVESDESDMSSYGRLLRSHGRLQESIKTYFTKLFLLEVSE